MQARIPATCTLRHSARPTRGDRSSVGSAGILETDSVPGWTTLSAVSAQSSMPLYLQAKAILISAIETGTFAAGACLPNTVDIAHQLRVSLLTAHRALRTLAEEGWLLRGQGHRTMVRRDFREAVSRQSRTRVGVMVNRTDLERDGRAQVLLAAVLAAGGARMPQVEQVVCSGLSVAELSARNFDAVLCVCPAAIQLASLEVLARQLPVVILGASATATNLCCVDSNHDQGARLAARHLLSLGHRRIARICGPDHREVVRARLAGSTAEFLAAGVIAADPWMIDTSNVAARALHRQRFVARMAASDRPTAIFATDLGSAMCAFLWLREEGIPVPGAVSLIGCEDVRCPEQVEPELTAVAEPLSALAECASVRLERLLTPGPTQPGRSAELLDGVLKMRQTTSCAASRLRPSVCFAV